LLTQKLDEDKEMKCNLFNKCSVENKKAADSEDENIQFRRDKRYGGYIIAKENSRKHNAK